MLDGGIIKNHTKTAYKYSTAEEYLLDFMHKHSSAYENEADDDLVLSVYNDAQDHNGEKMAWYSKAVLSDGVAINVGDAVSVSLDGDIVESQVVSINDSGIYMRAPNDKYIFGTVVSENGNLVYSKIDDSPKSDISHYLIPQFDDIDLKYKEAVKSNDVGVIRKRASFVLSNLERLFPTTTWSVKIVNSSGEDIEVVESCNI